ncbi:hypothetical protein ScPMuIL_005350 [Solemya velum]
MAVLLENEYGWVLDHKKCIDRQYIGTTDKATVLTAGQKEAVYNIVEEMSMNLGTMNFELKRDLFAVNRPFLMDSQFQAETMRNEHGERRRERKRKRKSALSVGEQQARVYHDLVKDKIHAAYVELKTIFQPEDPHQPNLSNNAEARKAAMILGPGDSLTELCEMGGIPQTGDRNGIQLVGGMSISEPSDVLNQPLFYDGATPTVVSLLGERYLLPAHCSFLLSDITHVQLLTRQCNNQYNLIVLDPPWENKSVKRLKKYQQLNNSDLINIPIPKLATAGCLLVVWVTNKEHHRSFVKDELFPAWNTEVLAEWHWLKVTNNGETVYDFESTHKKPYETLILGRFSCEGGQERHYPSVPDWRLLISVPCSLHSKKPPLIDVLKRYLPEKPKCLELFARNLMEGWTSWGNEVLKHQHLDYYQKEGT